jgi:hypothetical protein
MGSKTCPSCGGDMSSVPATRRVSAQFVVRVIRCPHCRLRQTFLTTRPARSARGPRQGEYGEDAVAKN